MLFDFNDFIEELRGIPEKSPVVELFEFNFGKIEGSIFDQNWYQNYVTRFSSISYELPEEIQNDFDWNLLLQLASASFSNDCHVKLYEDNEAHVLITVNQGEVSITKDIRELSGVQVYKLFCIYVEEQMFLQNLMIDEEEKIAINFQRDAKLLAWNQQLSLKMPMANDNYLDAMVRLIEAIQPERKMMFSFEEYIKELRGNVEKKSLLETFEKNYGNVSPEIHEQNWYKEYVSKFKSLNYAVPKEAEKDFDWDLLLRMAVSSFSSECKLSVVKTEIELLISVTQGETTVEKKVSELWGFQIHRLYEIYIEEQINLQNLLQDDLEKTAIDNQRTKRIREWNKNLVFVQSEVELNEILSR
jgi:hypothetical protein